MIAALVITLLGVSAVNSQFWPASPYYGGLPPLAVIAHNPISVARSAAKVPLILVPRQELTLLDNVHISSVSPTEPLVTCRVQKTTLDATPVVRVALQSPILVTSPEVFVGFPSQVNVIHQGLRMSLPVGALLAPIPEPSIVGPHVIRFVYALPSAPLSLRYPFFHPSVHYIRPQITTTVQIPDKKQEAEKKPVVPILDFPTELANPQTLFYQPPVVDEFTNRNPPEPLIFAGIAQSTQPHLILTQFSNSKESPFLSIIRDEATKNKDIPAGVEAL